MSLVLIIGPQKKHFGERRGVCKMPVPVRAISMPMRGISRQMSQHIRPFSFRSCRSNMASRRSAVHLFPKHSPNRLMSIAPFEAATETQEILGHDGNRRMREGPCLGYLRMSSHTASGTGRAPDQSVRSRKNLTYIL